MSGPPPSVVAPLIEPVRLRLSPSKPPGPSRIDDRPPGKPCEAPEHARSTGKEPCNAPEPKSRIQRAPGGSHANYELAQPLTGSAGLPPAGLDRSPTTAASLRRRVRTPLRGANKPDQNRPEPLTPSGPSQLTFLRLCKV